MLIEFIQMNVLFLLALVLAVLSGAATKSVYAGVVDKRGDHLQSTGAAIIKSSDKSLVPAFLDQAVSVGSALDLSRLLPLPSSWLPPFVSRQW